MKNSKELLKYIQTFFREYLPVERGLSQNTIHSYRDTLKLFLQDIAERKKVKVQALTPADLTAKNILSFLNTLEVIRKVAIRTRNQRLAVLKTFFSYLLTQDITRADQYGKVALIAAKRGPSRPMAYLTENEVEAILMSVNRSTDQGCRDYAILILLYNTGARVQEVCDLKISDIRLKTPLTVTLTGKGNKTRHVPLWDGTRQAIEDYLDIREVKDPSECLFVGKRGEPLSRFGIRYLVQARVSEAAKQCSTLAKKDIGPHTFRHTTGMHLLQSGVDLAVIQSWLGHADMNTTHNYIDIDMKMKEKALAKGKQPESAKKIRQILEKEKDVMLWLESL
jgi:integrase/recombinase XerD